MKASLYAGLLLAPVLAWSCSMSQMNISHPYVRATPEGQKITAAYFELQNKCNKAMDLVKVSTPLAAKVEMHEIVMNDGVAKMQPVDSIHLPAKKTTSLQPGGLHLMLIGVERSLTPGVSIPMTFTFGDGSTKAIAVPVKDIRQDEKEHHH